MTEKGRVLAPDDTIYDLVDVIASASGPRSGERIYDLVGVVEEGFMTSFPDPDYYRDEIMQKAAEIAEKITKTIVPDIAERIIREEIEKLKSQYSDE